MPTAAQQFASFSSSLVLGDVPAEVVEAARLHILDMLGCGLAAHGTDAALAARQAMSEPGVTGPATAIGVPAGLPAADAALVNGATCHALDFDDTHTDAISHVSVAVAPAALAVGQSGGAGGDAVLAATIAGNEIVTRLGMAVGPAFHARGFHPTAILGVFGAAAAAARLLGLDAAASANALGIAGSMASGLMEFLGDGSSTKQLHPGWAAHAGVVASRLAAHGASGPTSVIEGRFGLYRAFLGRDDVDITRQVADLGTRWETPQIAFKPYPACHFMHASIDAVARALNGVGLSADEIEEIVALSAEAGVPVVLEPLADKRRPRTQYEAKFSLPYSLAAMLVHGRVDVTTFSAQSIADEEVLRLAARVRYEIKPYPTYGRALPGGVRIRTHDGRTFEADVEYQRGGADNPMSPAEVVQKFRANAQLALDPHEVDALQEAILTLERHERLDALALLASRSADRALSA